MTTETAPENGSIWSCSGDELEQAIDAHTREFSITGWSKAEVDHFLELRFHLVRGAVSKEHIDEVLRIATRGQLKGFEPGNPVGLSDTDKLSEITFKLGTFVMHKWRFHAQSEKSLFWMYDEETGIWKPDAAEHIRGFVARYLGKQFKTHNENEVAGYIRSMSYPFPSKAVVLGGPSERIVVRNGVLNVDTGELTGFCPDEYHITALPVMYDAKADCPVFKVFLQDVLGKEDDRLAIVEHLGSCLHKIPYINVPVFVGLGANGKGVLLDVVKTFLGPQNVSSATLQQLEQRFQSSQLYGKLANVAGDIPRNALKYTGMVKMLTGGDSIMTEFKNRDPFTFVNYAKLWFSANELPASYDTTDAFHRRMRIIEFTRVFAPHDPATVPKEELVKRLTTDAELSGILNLALEGLRRLRRQGYLTGLKSIEASRVDYMRKSDPVQYFAYRFIEHDTHADPIPKPVLYELYMKMCHAIGKTPTSDGWFAKRLRRIVPYVDEVQTKAGDERFRGWTGISVMVDRLKDEGVDIAGITVPSTSTGVGQLEEALLADAPKVKPKAGANGFALADTEHGRWDQFLARVKANGAPERLTNEVMSKLFTPTEFVVIGRDLMKWEREGRVCRVLDGQDSHWKIMEGQL